MRSTFVLWPLMIFSAICNADVCQIGLDAFKKSFHQELMRSCIKCHGPGSPLPQHSHLEAAVAYPLAKKYINFPDFAGSSFLKKIQEKHWLKYDPKSEGMTPEVAMDSLASWYDQGEKDCPLEFNLKTEKLKIPSFLPHASENSYRTFRWNLETVSPDLKGAMLELQMQIFSKTETEIIFRLRNPRIYSPFPLEFEGILPFMNDQYNYLENNYLSLKGVIVPNFALVEDDKPLPAPNLSTSFLLVTGKPGVDNFLALGMGKIKKIMHYQKCKDLLFFYNTVKKEMIKNKCLSCHGDREQMANYFFPMNGQDETFCANLKQRTKVANPLESLFLQFPISGVRGHEVLEYQESRQLKEAFLSWFQFEYVE